MAKQEQKFDVTNANLQWQRAVESTQQEILTKFDILHTIHRTSYMTPKTLCHKIASSNLIIS